MHHSDLLEKIGAEYGLSSRSVEDELDKRRKFLEWLMKKKVFGFMEVSQYIAEYYRNREKVTREMAESPEGASLALMQGGSSWKGQNMSPDVDIVDESMQPGKPAEPAGAGYRKNVSDEEVSALKARIKSLGEREKNRRDVKKVAQQEFLKGIIDEETFGWLVANYEKDIMEAVTAREEAEAKLKEAAKLRR